MTHRSLFGIACLSLGFVLSGCGANAPPAPQPTASGGEWVQLAADLPDRSAGAQDLPKPPDMPRLPPPIPDMPTPPPPPTPPVPPPPAPDRPTPPKNPTVEDLNEELRKQNRELQHALDATVDGAPVKHVVVMWLKKPGDKADRKALLDAASQLRTIPGVVSVSAGECMKSDRPIVDSTYDVAMVMTFKDAKALEAYGPHPTHQKLVEEVLKPRVEKFLVYDFK